MIKARLVLLGFMLFFTAIIFKLFYLQVISPITSSDYLKYRKITPERGKILDRSGEPLAVNQTTYLLFVEPKKTKNFDDLIEELDKELKVGEATLEARIDKNKDWVSVKSGISKEAKDRLEKTGIEGIGFERSSQRYYPESSLSAHLLGFVGKNKDGEDTGYFGVEGYYEKDLFGLPGLFQTERDLFGKPILIGTQEKTGAQNGRDLVLTIDKSVQRIAKKQLKAGMERYRALEGCVIIADPKTGEILALSCLPDFDPDRYFLFSEEYFKNPAITSVYEPGSTFKPLIVAAALNEKKIKPDDFYDENGSIELGGYRIKTWDDKYEGKITITRILEKSSNVGMVHIGNKLGKSNIYKYLQAYGFAEETQIDLQGEAESFIKPKKDWYDIDYATATFGQGIAVTPIQMVSAFSSIINGGQLMQPHVVKKAVFDGREREVRPQVKRRVVSNRTSEIIKKMLVSTVEHGEYKWAIPQGYKIGGKTGTAQIPIAGKYDPSRTIASFIGFAPADDPKFIALVVLREPRSSQYGSETAAPLFFDIARELLVYYNIPPQQ